MAQRAWLIVVSILLAFAIDAAWERRGEVEELLKRIRTRPDLLCK